MSRLRGIAPFLMVLSGPLLLSGIAEADPPITLRAGFTGSCRVPYAAVDYPLVPFGGLSASTEATPEEIDELFPLEYQGQPRRFVGLGLRGPGMQLTFEGQAHAVSFHLVYEPSGFIIAPAEILGATPVSPVELDTVSVSWDPLRGEYLQHLSRTSFDAGCAFDMEIDEQLLVMGTASVNLVAFYGPPESSLELWGTAIEIPDVEIADQELAVPVSVELGTWGDIKRLFQ